MPRRLGALIIAAACSALVAAAVPAGGASLACTKLKETSLHWDAVFAHVSSVSEAVVLRQQIAHYGFQHIIFDKDWCDDVEVLVTGLDHPEQQRAFFDEAYRVGFKVAFEPPYTYRKPHRGYLTAVFGITPTLNRANDLQRALAEKGYREGTDIQRVKAREWHVVLYRIPMRLKHKFAAEAKNTGFPVVSFER